MLIVCVMAASLQDRDGAKTILLGMYLVTPVRFVYADAGFAGLLVDWCRWILRTVLHIVRKAPDQKGFAVIPRRRVVERSLAWLVAHRRPARDYERHHLRGDDSLGRYQRHGSPSRLRQARDASAGLDPRRSQRVTLLNTL
jgi:transposase